MYKNINPVISIYSESITHENLKTVFPQVISASRATDIPAFYADWFMERLRSGKCFWQNPFNAAQKQLVSFAQTKAIVFWSKNPAPLVPYLSEIEDRGVKFYFQFTMNDYEKEGLEPAVPPIKDRLATFAGLAQNYPVIWRYDPVIFGDRLAVGQHMQILKYLMAELKELTPKLVFSFVDLYRRTSNNLKRFNPRFRAPDKREKRQFAMELAELRDKTAPELKLAACAETDLDYWAWGIEANSCVDPILINEICGEVIYRTIPAKTTARQGSLFEEESLTPTKLFEKDKNQRKACNCAPAKDIGSYRGQPCHHHCVYCYAGHARARS